jgi:hypothetical protein
MYQKYLLSLMVAAAMLVATSSAYSQGMESGQSRSRLGSSTMQQHSRAADGLARREPERRRSQGKSHAANPDKQGSDTAMEIRERRDERACLTSAPMGQI